MSNPCVEMPYSYLMAWFVLYFPMLMEPPRTASVSFMLRLEELSWTHDYLNNIRRILMNPYAYEVLQCLPSILDTELGEEYENVPFAENERSMTLPPFPFG